MFWYEFDLQVDLWKRNQPIDIYPGRKASNKVALNHPKGGNHHRQWARPNLTNIPVELSQYKAYHRQHPPLVQLGATTGDQYTVDNFLLKENNKAKLFFICHQMMMFFVGCIFIDYPLQRLQEFHQSMVDPQTGLLISRGFNQYFQKVNVYVVILPPHLT